MTAKFETEQAELLASPRFMADVATLAAALRGGTFPDTFATMFGAPEETAREVERAMQRKSDAGKARALERLARRCPGADWISTLAAEYRRRDAHAYEPASPGLIRGYCVEAAAMYLARGITPTRAAVVGLAHAALTAHRGGVSRTDISNALRPYSDAELFALAVALGSNTTPGSTRRH